MYRKNNPLMCHFNKHKRMLDFSWVYFFEVGKIFLETYFFIILSDFLYWIISVTGRIIHIFIYLILLQILLFQGTLNIILNKLSITSSIKKDFSYGPAKLRKELFIYDPKYVQILKLSQIRENWDFLSRHRKSVIFSS